MLAHLGIDLLKRSMVLDQAAVDSVAVEAVDAAAVLVAATTEILEAVLVVDQAVLVAVEIPAAADLLCLLVVYHIQ